MTISLYNFEWSIQFNVLSTAFKGNDINFEEDKLTSSWNIFASSSPIVKLSESSLSTLLVSSLSDSTTVNSKCSKSFSASASASSCTSGSASGSASGSTSGSSVVVILTSIFSVSAFSFSASTDGSSLSASAIFSDASSSSKIYHTKLNNWININCCFFGH